MSHPKKPCNVWARLAGAGALLFAAGCGGGLGLQPAPHETVDLVRRGPGGTTRLLAENVLFRIDRKSAIYLDDLNADIVLKDPTLPFVPANKDQYSIAIHRAQVSTDAASLAAVLNTYVFNDKDSPLRNLKLAFRGDRLVLTGEMKKGVWVGFEMEGRLSPTRDGLILMTPTVIKSMGLRVDGLMNLLGLEMAELLKTKEEKGVIMAHNAIIMVPGRLYPPPRLGGRIVDLAIRDGALHLTFEDGQAQPWPEMPVPKAPSYLAMWGGDVLINTALNLNSKMQILDTSPETPLIFALDRYREQLEAGFVVPTRAGHLIAYVPDVTSFDTPLDRFAPPTLPIPGMSVPPSDMGPGPVEPQRRR